MNPAKLFLSLTVGLWSFSAICAETLPRSINADFVQLYGSPGQVKHVATNVELSQLKGLTVAPPNVRASSFKLIPDSTNSPIEFVAVPSAPDLVSRKIVVRQSKCDQPNQTRFSLAPKVPRLDTAYLDAGLILFNDKNYDEALAYFHAAESAPGRNPNSKLDSYEARLRYNYARALHQTCLYRSYNTCQDALDRLSTIKDSITKDSFSKRVYNEEAKIDDAAVVRDIDRLNEYLAAENYKEAICNSNLGKQEVALKQLEAIQAERKTKAKAYDAVGVKPKRLATDIDFLRKATRKF